MSARTTAAPHEQVETAQDSFEVADALRRVVREWLDYPGCPAGPVRWAVSALSGAVGPLGGKCRERVNVPTQWCRRGDLNSGDRSCGRCR